MWGMRTPAFAPAMRTSHARTFASARCPVCTRASVPGVSSSRTSSSASATHFLRTPAPALVMTYSRIRAIAPAERPGRARASASVICPKPGRISVPAAPSRPAPAYLSAAPTGLGRVSAPAVCVRHSRASAPALWSRRTGASARPVLSRASAAVVRPTGPRSDVSFVGPGGFRPHSSPVRLSHSGASAIRVRHFDAAGPWRRSRDGVSAGPVSSARSGPDTVCSSRSSVSIADASFPESSPAERSAGSVAPTGAGGWRAALSRGTPIARRSYPSNVLRATRGPEAGRPPRTPVNSILRGFVMHRACRLSARPCILNGIDAPSPDGRNRSTTRGVKV